MMAVIWIWRLSLGLLYPCTVLGVCRFGSDPDCEFPCNCADRAPCDPDTGDCGAVGCAPGHPSGYTWEGSGCLVGNVAYNKAANQTGVHNFLVATKAVDGQIGTGTNANCAHPKAEAHTPAEWMVDLGELYLIQHVIIYNTHNSGGYFRLTEFEILVETADNSEQCGRHNDTVEMGASVTIECPPSTVGRYVRFRRVGGNQTNLVTLCEVIVWGHRYIDCSGCGGSSCDPVTGCETCPSGKQLPDCLQDCAAGRYGEGCEISCGQCKDADPCDVITGQCPGDCAMWYRGNACSMHTPLEDYGDENIMITLAARSDEVEVLWEQQKDIGDSIAQYYGYVVEYQGAGGADWTEYLVTPHQTATSWRTEVISGLEPGHTYSIRIRIYTDWQGTKHLSDWPYPTQSFNLPCTAPGPPVIESAVSEPAGSVTVTYQLPDSVGCGTLTSLKLEYGHDSSNQQWSIVDLSVSSGSYVLRLDPGQYQIRLTATNSGGLSAFSEQTVTVVESSAIPANTTSSTTSSPTVRTTTSTMTRTPPVHVPPVTTQTSTTATTVSLAGGGVAPSSDDTRTVTVAVAVVVTVVVVLALTVTLVFVIRSRGGLRRGKPSKKDKLKMSIQRIGDGVTVGQENPTFTADDVTAMTSAANEHPVEAVYENTDLAKIDPIPVSELQGYVQRVRESLLTQYKKLPQEDHSKCGLAETDENKLKNRFLNIHAYEHSRVQLDPTDEDPDSGYINANYIKGFNGDKEYIATQGPKPHTIFDFWRMIWAVQCNRVVMVTNLVENTKTKCDQYWPSSVGETVTHTSYTVTMETEEHYADYKIRAFTLQHDGESRTVRHFHFTSWEDKKRPLYGAAPLLAFRRLIRSHDSDSTGPILVHCSAGVGRTGTLIALDIILQQAEVEQQVEIFNCIRDMRHDRMNMVQTKDQYVFLHDALVEAVTSGQTSCRCRDFPEVYRSLCDRDSTELERQFSNRYIVPSLNAYCQPSADIFNHKVLRGLQTKITTVTKDGWKEVNRHKNRDPDIVPEDTDRPYLATRDPKGNSYINAVYTDSFRAHDAYIVSQMPLPSTQSDLWRLVYDHRVDTIVMLDPPQPDDETCNPYWPDVGSSQKYGPILVELVSETTHPATDNIVQRDFQISVHSDKRGDGEVRTVRQFQWLGWALDRELPENKAELQTLHTAAQRPQTTPAGRTLVHCQNGAARSGLYCVWAFVLDKLRAEEEVDVFLAVRYVASRRPQFVESLEQYKFLYDLAADALSRSEYENV